MLALRFFNDYKKQILILLAVVFAISALITAGKKTKSSIFDNALGFIVTPLQSITTTVSGWFGDRISSFKDENDVYDENEELKAKVQLLETENKRLALYEDENAKLAKLLEISQKYPEYDTTATNIIGKDPGNWYNVFVINKGTKDGITADMVLTSAGGVVGKITEAGLTYSKAQSILDNRSSVAAMSLRTGDLGVVRGDYYLMNDGLCRMEYIDVESEIMKGDEIVTSHLSDIYPPGLTLGYVKEIVTDTNGLTKYAIIEPQVDFKHLATLLIITKSFDKATTGGE
ncbi:MAG TPA: rod shape-determining protein MreC [Lachnospiraceae bacterium]|nr:rod shape-determining protein MreC [Lachnospiraceae bacterium]